MIGKTIAVFSLLLMSLCAQPCLALTIDLPISPTNTGTKSIRGTVADGSTVSVSTDTSASDGEATVSGGTWEYTVTGLVEGANVVTVTATAPDSTILTETIVRDSEVPALTVSTLTNGAVTNNATLNVNGVATDNDALASLTVNGTTVPVDGNGTFSHVVTLVVGGNAIDVVASDQAGNQAIDSRTVTLDITAPTLNVSQPVDNSVTADSNCEVAGTVDDQAAAITLTVNGGPPQNVPLTGLSFTTTVSLAAGANTVEVTAVDGAGNSSSVKRSIVLDTQAPSLAVTEPPEDLSTNAGTLTLRGTVADPLSTVVVTVAVDGATYTPPISGGLFEQSLSFAAEKNYPIVVTARDGAGNQASVTRTIVYDVTPPNQPVVTVSSPTNDASPLFSWTSNGGNGTFLTGLDSSDQAAAILSTTPSYRPATPLGDGDHTLYVWERDAAGNWSQPGSVTVTVDTIPPASPSVWVPSFTASRQPTFTWSGSGGGNGTYRFRLDGGDPDENDPATTSVAYTPATLLTEGQHVLRVQERDAVGNWSQSGSATTIVDVTPPTVSAGAGRLANASFSQAGTATDASPLTLAWSKVSGPGSITFGQPAAATTTVAAGQDGVYVIRLTAVDAAGNSAYAEATVTWDTATPTATLSGAPSGVTKKKEAVITVGGEGVVAYRYTLDSGQQSAEIAINIPVTLNNLSDGSHTVSVVGGDQAGNWQPTPTTATWTVDTTAPTVSAGAGRTANSQFTQTGTVTDATATTLAWSKVSGPGTITFGQPSAATTVAAGSDGIYVIRLTATDAAGNSAYADATITWDTTAPTVSAGTGRTANSQFTQTGSVSDATATILAWSKVSGPGTVTFGQPSAASTSVAMNQDGEYVIRLTATDAAGNSAYADAAITWDTVVPSVSVSGGKTTNTAITLTGTASDAGALTYAWTKTSGPGTVTFGQPSAAVTTVSADTDGTYVVRLTVTDASGNASHAEATFVWDTTRPTVSAGTGRTTSIQITQTGTATDATATTYAWSKVSGPGVVTFGQSTALSTTVAMDQDGVYVIRLTATDAAGNSAYADATITWDTTRPTVSAGAGRTANSQFTQTGTVTDATATTYGWSKVSGPGTVTFGQGASKSTSVAMDQDGVYVIRLTATDAAGNSAYADATITWDTTRPTVSAGTGRTARSQFTQTGSVSDATATTLAWSKVSGQGTITFGQPSTAATTVTASSDGVYVIRLTAVDAAGNSAYAEATITWDTTNPAVSAGGGRSTNSTFTQTGSVSDATATSLAWSKAAGPGSITFGQPSAAATTVTAGSDGVYVIRLTATDAAGNSAYADATITWDTTAPGITGATTSTSNGSYGAGSVIDVGMTFSKAITSAGLTLTMSSGATIATGALNGVPSWYGTYTVAAGENTADLTVTMVKGIITDVAGNSATDPAIAAGQNIGDTRAIVIDTILPTVSVSGGRTTNAPIPLTGTASDAGVLSYAWTKTSGPGAATFGQPSAAISTVSADRDGSYVVRLTATDAAGNSSFAEAAFIWDTTKPVVSAGAGKAVNSEFTQSGTVTDATATTYSWSKVSGPGTVTFGQATAKSTTVAMDQEGDYVIRLTAVDAAGNSNFSDAAITWDTTAPTATLSGAPAGATRQTGAAITVGGAGVTAYRYTLDNGQQSVESGTAATLSLSSLGDGSHTVSVVGRDLAGNWQATPTTATWTVDTTPPAVSAGAGRSTNTSFTQTGTVTDATAISLSWTKTSGPGAVDFGQPAELSTTITADKEGTYIVRLTAMDAAGNTSYAETSFVWDTTASSPPLVSGVTPTPTNSRQPTWGWQSGGNGGNGTFRCKLNDADLATGATEVNALQFRPDTALGEGSNILYVQERDAAGNWSASGSATIVVDITPPVAALTGRPPAQTTATGATVTVTGNEVVAYQYKLDNDGYSAERPTSLPIALSGLAEGVHRLSVVGRDAAGNWQAIGEATTASWTVDVSSPIAELAGVPPLMTNVTAAIISVGGAGVVSYRFRFDELGWSEVNGVGAAIIVYELTEGVHTLEVIGSDSAGNWQPEASSTVVQWTVDLVSPQMDISMLKDGSYTAEPKLNVSGTATDEKGLAGVKVNGVAVALDQNGGFERDLILTPGPNTITVVAADLAGNQVTKARTIYLDQNAPKVSIAIPADNSTTNVATARLQGTVDESSTLAVRVNNGADQTVPLSSGSFDASIPLTRGVNTIELVATDLTGNVNTVKRTVTYDDVVPILEVTEPASDIRTDQGTVVVRGTVSDPVTAVTLTIDKDGVNSVVPLNNGAFEYTLTMVERKIYRLLIRATDEAGNEATVKREVIFSRLPNGDLNSDTKVDIADALIALQISVGLLPQTDSDVINGDVAPFVNSRPDPDGFITAGDAMVILKRALNIISTW